MAWYHTAGQSADTVISTRVRLARNINGYPFASKLDAGGANEIIEKVAAPLEASGFRKINFSDISATVGDEYFLYLIYSFISLMSRPSSSPMCASSWSRTRIRQSAHSAG